jgi:hypothetical protein
MALLQSHPFVYSSLSDHQSKDPLCVDLGRSITDGLDTDEKFQLHKGLLVYCPRGARRRRFVVPETLRPMLLHYFHDSALAGHLGAFKTRRKVAANFFWPKMRSEIFEYVKKCELCQSAKPAQSTQIGLHSAEPSSIPMERIFIDFMGPLVRSKRGNTAILVVVDGFSKFVVFYPTRALTAQAVCDKLERGYFPAYGTPSSVVSDNAQAFRSRSFRDMCFRWGIQHITTTPYYPQGSLAERVNRNLKAPLKIFCHAAHNTWDVELPWLSLAFNTAVHESTGVTPDKIFLGRELMSPLDVVWDLTDKEMATSAGDNQIFWEQALQNLKKARNKVARRYDANRLPSTHQVGDMVMYKLRLGSSKVAQRSAKIQLKWSKPAIIARMVRPNVALLANPETGVVIRRAHVGQLKPYH